jgi:hypothetical protein
MKYRVENYSIYVLVPCISFHSSGSVKIALVSAQPFSETLHFLSAWGAKAYKLCYAILHCPAELGRPRDLSFAPCVRHSRNRGCACDTAIPTLPNAQG